MRADEKLRQAVYGVLEKLRECQIRANGMPLISYPLVPPIVNTDFFGLESQALNYLTDKGIIKETGERVTVEIGEPGSSSYKAHESLSFTILQPLDEFHSLMIREDIASQPSQFTFWIASGQFVSRKDNGELVSVTFNPKGNQYQLIFKVIQAVGELIPLDKCIKRPKTKRTKKDKYTPEERTRDTIKSIRSSLKKRGVPSTLVDSIFEIDYGVRVAVPFTVIPVKPS